MRLQSLRHLVDSARALAQSRRIVVLGSAAFLASFPEIGEKGQPLEATLDADFVLDPMNSDLADLLRDAIGEPSILYEKHGYYADCLRPEIVETFPAGWEGRLVPFAGYDDVFCLDPYDVALVKLVVGRKKDLALVGWLVKTGRLESGKLEARYCETPLAEPDMFRAGRNLQAVRQSE